MADVKETKTIVCRYLDRNGSDLAAESAVFVSIDLMHGALSVYGTEEYAEAAPVLVGAGWHMRWPIPAVNNDRANALMNDLTPDAESLMKVTAMREDPLGVILHAGAGTVIDEIQRKCARLWRELADNS